MKPKILLIEQTSTKSKDGFRLAAEKAGFDIDFATWKVIKVDTSKKNLVTINGKGLGEYCLVYIRILEL